MCRFALQADPDRFDTDTLHVNKITYGFCSTVARLDRIPRYGRFYPVKKPDGTRYRPLSSAPAQWRWQKRGRWGMNLLIKWKLFFDFLDEYERRHPSK